MKALIYPIVGVFVLFCFLMAIPVVLCEKVLGKDLWREGKIPGLHIEVGD